MLKAVGVDDGYFPIKCKELKCKTIIAAVLCEGMTPIQVSLKEITVDGLDGTDVAYKAIKSLKEIPQVVFIDGVTVAGFNVIDPESLHLMLGSAIISVFKHDLSLDKIERALKKHFRDWRVRLETIVRVYRSSRSVPTPWRALRVSIYGMSVPEALDCIIKLQNISPIPEPLRLADLIASGLTERTPLLKYLNKSLIPEMNSC